MFDRNTLNSINDAAGLTAVPGSLGTAINLGMGYVFGIAGIILLLNIVASGLKLMTSQGEPKALQMAQAKLTTSAIGILILFSSYWIAKLIMQFFGINVLIFDVI